MFLYFLSTSLLILHDLRVKQICIKDSITVVTINLILQITRDLCTPFLSCRMAKA